MDSHIDCYYHCHHLHFAVYSSLLGKLLWSGHPTIENINENPLNNTIWICNYVSELANIVNIEHLFGRNYDAYTCIQDLWYQHSTLPMCIVQYHSTTKR